ncbi:hypothetical protein CC79DRAFT_1395058 [Sarocladium strictum]
MTKAYAQISSETWNFRYGVEDEYSPYVGVYHTVELSAVFGPDYVPGDCADCSYKTYNKNIVPVVMSYWISFIRSLNPNTHKLPGSPVWEPWRSCEGGNRLRFETNNTQMEKVPMDQLERCGMWEAMSKCSEQ